MFDFINTYLRDKMGMTNLPASDHGLAYHCIHIFWYCNIYGTSSYKNHIY